MSAADPVSAVQAYLSADPALTAAVGSRVFTRQLPRPESDAQPRAAVLIDAAGGAGGGPGARSGLPVSSERVAIRAYGPTEYEAMRVHRLLHRAMRDLGRRLVELSTGARVLVQCAVIADGPHPAQEDPGDWPYVDATYVVDFAVEEVI